MSNRQKIEEQTNILNTEWSKLRIQSIPLSTCSGALATKKVGVWCVIGRQRERWSAGFAEPVCCEASAEVRVSICPLMLFSQLFGLLSTLRWQKVKSPKISKSKSEGEREKNYIHSSTLDMQHYLHFPVSRHIPAQDALDKLVTEPVIIV